MSNENINKIHDSSVKDKNLNLNSNKLSKNDLSSVSGGFPMTTLVVSALAYVGSKFADKFVDEIWEEVNNYIKKNPNASEKEVKKYIDKIAKDVKSNTSK